MFGPVFRRWSKKIELSEADRQAVMGQRWTLRSFRKSEYIVREGSSATECGFIVGGYAYRQKVVESGARQIMSIHIPGEFVDLQNSLFAKADHNVQSLGASTLAMLSRRDLTALIDQHPAVGRALWLDTLVDAAIFREWVVNVGRRDSRTRVSHLICEHVSRLQAVGAGTELEFQFPITQLELADCTGLTAVHVNRVLQDLRQQELIELRNGKLRILDWTGLQRTGAFDKSYLHHAA